MVGTLAELLQQRAEGERRDWDVRILHAATDAPPGHGTDGSDQGLALGYGELWELARRAAFGLARGGVAAGDRVLLLLPTSASFLGVFFGCQLLGAAPVPLVPPWSPQRQKEHAERVSRVASVCQARVAVTEARFVPALSDAGLSLLLGQELLRTDEMWRGPTPAQADRTAFIQFTSGSTSEPRGVVVEHGAALANCRFIAQAVELGPDDIGCSWLPLFHDMGLIGHVLVPLFARTRSVLMPPEAFMLQPRVWLEAISRYRATISTAPNFAYDLCAQKPAQDHLDLKSWRVAMCGAETVRSETLARFAVQFSGSGFDARSFRPVYGLAEATLAVTIPPPRPAPRYERIDRAALEEKGRALPAAAAAAAVEVAGLGYPDAAHALRIRGAHGETLGEREVGQIELAGPAVMKEYFRDPAATAAVLEAGWLRTGDLGYLADGELFVTGRVKELIVQAGRNVYPYDVELAAERVAGVRAGRSAAFGVPNAASGTEDLVLVCETRLRHAEQRRQLIAEILASVFAATGLRPDGVHLLKPRTLNRTSSGKVQRALVRERFLRGELTRVDG